MHAAVTALHTTITMTSLCTVLGGTMHARTGLLTITIVAATLTACGGNDSSTEAEPAQTATTAAPSAAAAATTHDTSTPAEETAEPSPTPTKAGKYEQTWKTPYSNTRCGAFLNDMNGHERWVTAADMLTNAHKADGGSDLPADSEVSRFEEDMSTACQGSADVKITEVGAALYLMDPSYKP